MVVLAIGDLQLTRRMGGIQKKWVSGGYWGGEWKWRQAFQSLCLFSRLEL
jgi:hypothetical protein